MRTRPWSCLATMGQGWLNEKPLAGALKVYRNIQDVGEELGGL